MKNAAPEKFDPYLSLLDYRNKPTEVGSSPAESLFSRRTRNLLPLTPKQLEPVTVPLQDVQQRLIASRQRQVYYYNPKGKALPEVQPGLIVRMKKPNESTWTETVCKKMIGPRSYAVVSGHRIYRGNGRQLRLVTPTDQAVRSHVSSKQSHATGGSQVLNQCAPPIKNLEGPKPVPADPNTIALPVNLTSNSTITTSGRIVTPPVRFKITRLKELFE